MRCMICGFPCRDFLTVSYITTAFCELALHLDLPEAKLCKCENCGSVRSETHANLPTEKIGKLMREGHAFWERLKERVYSGGLEFPIGTAPHLQIAALAQLLLKNGIARPDNIVDYAAGYGHLGSILKKYFSVKVKNYEPFAKSSTESYTENRNLSQVSLMLNSAMFQCLNSLDAFDHLCSMLSSDGVLLLQTVAAENITRDLARHLFYTPMTLNIPSNKGMAIVMEKFGFRSSCYSKCAKSWVFFQQEMNPRIFNDINSELQTDALIYEKGFVGYWK